MIALPTPATTDSTEGSNAASTFASGPLLPTNHPIVSPNTSSPKQIQNVPLNLGAFRDGHHSSAGCLHPSNPTRLSSKSTADIPHGPCHQNNFGWGNRSGIPAVIEVPYSNSLHTFGICVSKLAAGAARTQSLSVMASLVLSVDSPALLMSDRATTNAKAAKIILIINSNCNCCK